MIASSVRLGDGVVIHHPDLVNLYGCTIGDGSRIGTFVEIQRGASIGKRCKISSHTFICEGVTIEDGVFVGHGVMFTNDLRPRAVDADGRLLTDADWALVQTRVRARGGHRQQRDDCRGRHHRRGRARRRRRRRHARRAGVRDRRRRAGTDHRFDARRGRDNGGGSRRSGNPVIGIGVIGYGYWGPNLVRNFSDVSGCDVVAVARPAAGAARPRRAATPVRAHLGGGGRRDRGPARRCGRHCDPGLEPLRSRLRRTRRGQARLGRKAASRSTPWQASRLVDQADRAGLTLHVDHTFAYTTAVRKIRELVVSDALGQIYYYDSVRVNLGLFQHDVDVIWDLAVHDLSIIDYVLPEKPIAVSATGMAHVPGEPENIAYITLFFESSLIAHVHVNWLAPVKVRRTLIGGDRRMVVYDDLEPSEKVKVYDKGITTRSGDDTAYQMQVGYRTGDMWAPQLDVTEALHTEGVHFLECIAQGTASLTDGRAGLRVVQILEAASRSMRERGRVIELEAKRCAA